LVGNYLLNYLLKTRNKPYTTTLCPIKKTTLHSSTFGFSDTQAKAEKPKDLEFLPTCRQQAGARQKLKEKRKKQK